MKKIKFIKRERKFLPKTSNVLLATRAASSTLLVCFRWAWTSSLANPAGLESSHDISSASLNTSGSFLGKMSRCGEKWELSFASEFSISSVDSILVMHITEEKSSMCGSGELILY